MNFKQKQPRNKKKKQQQPHIYQCQLITTQLNQ